MPGRVIHPWRSVVAILSSGLTPLNPTIRTRRQIVELFDAWHVHQGERPVKASALPEPVRVLVDPQGRGRQHIAARRAQLTGTRAGAFVLTRQEPAGKWGAANLLAGPHEQGIGVIGTMGIGPVPPMVPMSLPPSRR